MKNIIYILLIGLLALTSCDKLVNDMPVTCINKTDTTLYVVFFITDYPVPTIANIVTNNRLPVATTMNVLPKETKTITIYEADRLSVWYGVYIGELLYVTGKVYNPTIIIE